MAGTPEQKRRYQAALRRVLTLLREEHPTIWADLWERAKAETGEATKRDIFGYTADERARGLAAMRDLMAAIRATARWEPGPISSFASGPAVPNVIAGQADTDPS